MCEESGQLRKMNLTSMLDLLLYQTFRLDISRLYFLLFQTFQVNLLHYQTFRLKLLLNRACRLGHIQAVPPPLPRFCLDLLLKKNFQVVPASPLYIGWTSFSTRYIFRLDLIPNQMFRLELLLYQTLVG